MNDGCQVNFVSGVMGEPWGLGCGEEVIEKQTQNFCRPKATGCIGCEGTIWYLLWLHSSEKPKLDLTSIFQDLWATQKRQKFGASVLEAMRFLLGV